MLPSHLRSPVGGHSAGSADGARDSRVTATGGGLTLTVPEAEGLVPSASAAWAPAFSVTLILQEAVVSYPTARQVVTRSPVVRHHGQMADAPAIRTASEADRDPILGVIEDAFSDHSRDGREEVEIAEATWSRRAVPHGLELVATEGRNVVGHVLTGWGALAGRDVVGIAPLAVLPDRQGDGIGSALMIELLRRAERGRAPAGRCSWAVLPTTAGSVSSRLVRSASPIARSAREIPISRSADSRGTTRPTGEIHLLLGG